MVAKKTGKKRGTAATGNKGSKTGSVARAKPGRSDADGGTLRAKEGCPSRAERVQIISEIMARNEWRKGTTGEELAEQWSLHVDTVRRDAKTASDLVKRSILSDSELLEYCDRFLRENAALARVDKQYAASAASLRTLLEARGMLRERRDIHITGELATKSDDELRKLIAEEAANGK